MRVSTSQIYSIADIGMRDAQVSINKTNEQISSGKRVLSPSDDPVAATSILMLNQELARTTQFNKNINIAENNLNLEETTLDSVVALVQRTRELAVKAGNTAALSASDYKAIAAEIDGSIGQLLNLQNTRNASGQYIFGGYQSETIPFVDKGQGNYSYQGDEGQLQLQVSPTVKVAVNDSGQNVFMNIPSSHNTFNASASSSNKSMPPAFINVGEVVDQEAYDKFFPKDMVITFNEDSAVVPPASNYTISERLSGKVISANQVYSAGQEITVNGVKVAIFGSPSPATTVPPSAGDSFVIESSENQSLLTTLSRFSTLMKNAQNNPASREDLAALAAKTLTNLDSALNVVVSTQSDVGARLNLLDNSRDLNLDVELSTKTVLSQIEDLDYAEASTRLQMQTLVLSAAQQTFVKVSELSLFKYM